MNMKKRKQTKRVRSIGSISCLSGRGLETRNPQWKDEMVHHGKDGSSKLITCQGFFDFTTTQYIILVLEMGFA